MQALRGAMQVHRSGAPARRGLAPGRRGVLLAIAAALAGCATPPRKVDTGPQAAQSWSGRMALQVDNQPSNSFSAGFELRGAPEAGELSLFSPLGGVLAVLRWQPGSAILQSSGQARQYASLDELAVQATGTQLPVAALFDWLAGKARDVPGWRVDLTQLAEGRLRAQRHDPLPAADLRVLLER